MFHACEMAATHEFAWGNSGTRAAMSPEARASGGACAGRIAFSPARGSARSGAGGSSVTDLKRRLARLLYEKSYRQGDFTLASGKKSDYYFDCRVTALSAEGSWLIGNLFNDMLSGLAIQGVGGMTMGADPLVSATTVISHERKRPLNGFLVRKEAKSHGTGQFIEGLGNFAPGDSVAMLEDVVTTGGSVLLACDRARSSGLAIAAVCAILDREEGGREALAEAGYNLLALYTRRELLELAS